MREGGAAGAAPAATRPDKVGDARRGHRGDGGNRGRGRRRRIDEGSRRRTSILEGDRARPEAWLVEPDQRARGGDPVRTLLETVRGATGVAEGQACGVSR